ncbi:MAG: DUF1015 domain-containing protein [Bacteroidetes bacterium]|nr:DUF1015 domain-containing protein [Bacteroidota bacterium]HET6244088.1 DUF1015 family protein [Bacteroidia bacterium]
MAVIKPFKGIRPSPDKVHLVASRPIDTYKPEELEAKLKENPYTFLRIIKPDFGKKTRSKPGSIELLNKIKSNFISFIKEGIFIQDNQECLYIYSQEKNGRSHTGIIGCASIDDYFNGVIKIHEQTITHKEETLKKYLEICDFNAEPVCLTYPADNQINEIINEIINNQPVYDFSTTNKNRHKLWLVNNPHKIQAIVDLFKRMPAIYIADGHHRSASSALLGRAKRQYYKDYSGQEPFNFFMSIYFAEDQVQILDFNRVVIDLNGLSQIDFLQKVSLNFKIEEIGTQIYKPNKLHNFSMYLGGKWYSLISPEGTFNKADSTAILDASILSENILGPVLGINDLRTDKRIGFISGALGLEELKNQVDSGKMKVGFALFPVTMDQIKAVANEGKSMPPKSTWVEPKLRNGLTIYSLS